MTRHRIYYQKRNHISSIKILTQTRSSHLWEMRYSDTVGEELEAAGLGGVAVHSQPDCLTVRGNQAVSLKHSSPVVRYIFCFNHSLLLIEKRQILNNWMHGVKMLFQWTLSVHSEFQIRGRHIEIGFYYWVHRGFNCVLYRFGIIKETENSYITDS